jgi:hypothetical protein
MRITATLLGTVSAIGLLGALAANAQTADPQHVPGNQALESIDKNIAKDKDADNRGLLNAKKRIEANQARRDLRDAKVDKVDKVDKPDKPDRPDKPEKPGRL